MPDIDSLVWSLQQIDWEVVDSGPDGCALRLETDEGECVLEISEDRDAVRLEMIRAEPAGRGVGSEGLARLLEAARDARARLVLDVRPQADGLMGARDLAGWYERFGWREDPSAGQFGMSLSADAPSPGM